MPYVDSERAEISGAVSSADICISCHDSIDVYRHSYTELLQFDRTFNALLFLKSSDASIQKVLEFGKCSPRDGAP